MAFEEGIAIGDGWSESTYVYRGPTNTGLAVNSTRLRINLDTTTLNIRPIVRKIRLAFQSNASTSS